MLARVNVFIRIVAEQFQISPISTLFLARENQHKKRILSPDFVAFFCRQNWTKSFKCFFFSRLQNEHAGALGTN
jgi:hypothetical protein